MPEVTRILGGSIGKPNLGGSRSRRRIGLRRNRTQNRCQDLLVLGVHVLDEVGDSPPDAWGRSFPFGGGGTGDVGTQRSERRGVESVNVGCSGHGDRCRLVPRTGSSPDQAAGRSVLPCVTTCPSSYLPVLRCWPFSVDAGAATNWAPRARPVSSRCGLYLFDSCTFVAEEDL